MTPVKCVLNKESLILLLVSCKKVYGTRNRCAIHFLGNSHSFNRPNGLQMNHEYTKNKASNFFSLPQMCGIFLIIIFVETSWSPAKCRLVPTDCFNWYLHDHMTIDHCSGITFQLCQFFDLNSRKPNPLINAYRDLGSGFVSQHFFEIRRYAWMLLLMQIH
jgi:hypothetical protein